jgi:hypothetical protein
MSESTNTEVNTVTPAVPAETAGEGTDGQGGTSGTDTVDRAAYEALRAELDAFKRRTAEVSGRYAEAHSMCGVVDTALAELGLRRIQTGHRITVSLVASWDVKASSRGKAGAPSESNMWRQVELLASVLRYDGVEDVKRRYAEDNSELGHLVIETAEVKAVTSEPSPDAHLIPIVRQYACPACELRAPLDTGGTCRNCGEELNDTHAL